MIKLKKLELVNFLSHVNTSIQLDSHQGLILIEGVTKDGHYSSNGSGKSTILEGIVYALTGETLRGLAVNDVVNRNYKKDTRVTLEFSIDDVEYKVSRYRKDTQFGDSLVLYRGEENISKRVNKETQKELEDIIGISYKLLTSTVLLGEGLSSRFTQLSDPEKKSLIESTLNLTFDMNKVRDSANSRMKELKLQEATLEGEISVLSHIGDIDVEMLEDSINDNKSLIKIYEETISHLKEEYSRLSGEIDSINPKLQIINEAISKYKELAGKYTELKRANDHYQEERDRVLSGQSPACTMCGQLLQSLESKQSAASYYDNLIQGNISTMNDLEIELRKLPDQNTLIQKSEELSREYTEKSAKSRELLDEHNSYNIKITQAKKDIEIAIRDLDAASSSSEELEGKLSQKSIVSKNISKYDYFYKLFSPTGIIVNILTEAIDYINDRLRAYSEVLLEKDYHLNFVKGKISLVDSKGSSYQSLSNGEKRRLDIALQFSLHDYVHMYCGMKLNCCYIDEILDTLDDTGVDNIFDILRMKLDYCNLDSIYVITHNDSLKDHFDNIITVLKDEKGDSHIS